MTEHKQGDDVDSTKLLAIQFCKILRHWLTVDELAQVVQANDDETDDSICHSHDVCDANQAMIDAYDTLGWKLDLQDDGCTALINSAWAIAKHARFQWEVI